MNNNKQELLGRSATYKIINGVTYFKLRSDFEGDYTKNCGLLGEEIDGNFYFLRGYDIDSIYVTDKRELVINRVDKNYEPIKINLNEALGKDEFNFDKETGVITIIHPDGSEDKMDGFFVESQGVKIATDATLDGDGTLYNPLRVSVVDATGTYAPVEDFFNLTTTIKMPEGKYKGYRIVTKEKIDNFGCLYPLSAVKKIQDKLTETNSQWRVPSKEDWDELLNSLEIDSSFRNHDSLENKWLGKVAGAALKSVDLWDKYDTLPSEQPTNGQDIVELSILPLGIGPDRNEIIDESDYDIEGFGKLGGVWTNTVDKTGNAYVKIFGYNSAQVDQDTYGAGSKFSIRLVKDYDFNNYNEIETILGLPYPTSLVYGICDDVKYSKIWTKINVYDSSVGLGGVRSKEWDNIDDSEKNIKTVFFVNEWNGTEWSKKLMNDGDSLVIKKHGDILYHEWRLINGELVDTLEDVVNQFAEQLNSYDNQIDSLENAIKDETKLREEQDVLLNTKIENETSERKSQDSFIRTAIETEKQNRISEDKRLDDIISKEIDVRTQEVGNLKNEIVIEADERKNADMQEMEERKAADLIPGEYVLEGTNNKTMTIPTFGENVADVQIKLSDDFFNFGKIINE